jgi:hypothetical protein
VVYTDAAIPRWPEKTEGTTILWVVPSGCTPPYGEVVVWQPLHSRGTPAANTAAQEVKM